jgi:predicted dehydrogenase
MGTPLLMPGSAVGLGRPAPSERVTVGFIGVGWKGLRGCYGALVPDFLRNPVCQALAVCDVNGRFRAAAKATIDKLQGGNGCREYVDFRELVARPDVDAVVIATPPHWHAVQTIHACRQGKDVYCEKPLSLTVREARAMVEAARRHGRVVQTGSQSRSYQTIRLGVELIRSGRIGRVKRINAGCGGPPGPCSLPAEPAPDYIDWDLWLGPAPWRPYNGRLASVEWRPYRDYDGGGVTDWGCHHFDIGQWALGMDHSGPVEISLDPHAIFHYADGVEMHHAGADVEFIGTEGKITLHGMSPRITAQPERLARDPILPQDQVADDDETTSARDEPQCHTDNFLACVRSRRHPRADVEIGCRTATVSHLANIAYGLGRAIKWDPLREQIVGDEEAGRWLDRARREPWTI